jgi:hypothetical protein
MSLWSNLLAPFRSEWNRAAALRPSDGRILAGRRARLTTDQYAEYIGGMFTMTSPESPEEFWRSMNLDSKTLDALAPEKLTRLLADLSPEVSAALYFFLRMCNPGYEIAVTYPNSERPHKRGETAVAALGKRMDEQHGSFNLTFTKLFFGQFIRGAAAAELIIGRNGRTAVDIATPDPISFRFKAIMDPERGKVYQLGQWINGEWRPLDRPTIRYIPVDPAPGQPPYGRPMVAPALFTSLFLLSLLHDIKRVVSQQGYNRLDIEILSEPLANSMPAHIKNDPEKVRAFITNVISEIQAIYSNLQPDDAYIHTDVVKLNKPVGTADSNSLGAIDSLIRGLERMAARALKTMPLLLGINEATTETHASFQWVLQAASVEAMQHDVENMMSSLLRLALEAQGIQAAVTLRFATLSPQRLKDAQTEAVEIANELAKYQAGWTSQDEASMAVTGHEAEEEEPRTAAQAQPMEDQANDDVSTEEEDQEDQEAQAEDRSRQNGHRPLPTLSR